MSDSQVSCLFLLASFPTSARASLCQFQSSSAAINHTKGVPIITQSINEIRKSPTKGYVCVLQDLNKSYQKSRQHRITPYAGYKQIVQRHLKCKRIKSNRILPHDYVNKHNYDYFQLEILK